VLCPNLSRIGHPIHRAARLTPDERFAGFLARRRLLEKKIEPALTGTDLRSLSENLRKSRYTLATLGCTAGEDDPTRERGMAKCDLLGDESTQ